MPSQSFYTMVARNEVTLSVTPLSIRILNPQKPDIRELSVIVSVQLTGSVLSVCQILAQSVEPTTRKRRVYDVPAVAENGAVPRIVLVPLTLFSTTNWEPSKYALYQSFVSVQRNAAPRLVLPKLLCEPLNKTSASVAVGPSVA